MNELGRGKRRRKRGEIQLGKEDRDREDTVKRIKMKENQELDELKRWKRKWRKESTVKDRKRI